MYPLTLWFRTRNMQNCWLFYSAIGAEWESVYAIMPDPVPEEDEVLKGMPDHYGTLGGVEIHFYYDDSSAPAVTDTFTCLSIEFNDGSKIFQAVEKLEAAGLFQPAADFDHTFGGIVLDPDGRQVHLRQPDLHRMGDMIKSHRNVKEAEAAAERDRMALLSSS